VAANHRIYVELAADISSFVRGMNDAAAKTEALGKKMEATGQRVGKLDKHMTRVGQGSLAAGTAMAAGLTLSARAAVQWESAWAGVTKTVNGSASQMATLEGELKGLARVLPATHTEIAAVAEAAGALGIKREAIASFTRTMIDLGETTDLTADQAATALARIANVMGTAPAEIGRMGAALVALGNDGASTESEIVEMAKRIAGSGNIIGLTEAQVLGFASALSSVGIEAEAGGSAISRVMVDIATAVETGNDKLAVFADVAGMSGSGFAQAFRTDAAGAIDAFVQGLGRLDASGESTFGVLEQLELSEVRVRDALLRTAGAGSLLADSLRTGERAWEQNTALVDEAAKRYDTTEAKLRIAQNSVKEFAADLGAALLPAVAGAGEAVGDLGQWLADLPEPAQQALAVLGTMGAAVGLVGGAALLAVPKLAALQGSLVTLGMTSQRASGLVGGLGLAMAGLGIVSGWSSASTSSGRPWPMLHPRPAR
jgi:TP901 family phage tail tape measure protein